MKTFIRRKSASLYFLSALVGAFLISGMPVANASLTFSSTAIVSSGVLTLTGSGNSTWDIGAGILSLQTTNNGIVALGGNLLLTAGTAIDSLTAGALSIGTTTSTSVTIGKLGQIITMFGETSSTAFRTPSATIPTLSGAVTIKNSGSLTVFGVASSTEFITPSGTISTLTVPTSITLGGGTAITKKVCNNASLTFPSLVSGASSTVSLLLSGMSTSSNQVYSASLATSTPTLGGSLLHPFAFPSSTAGAINVNVGNSGATWNGGAVNVSACYDQF